MDGARLPRQGQGDAGARRQARRRSIRGAPRPRRSPTSTISSGRAPTCSCCSAWCTRCSTKSLVRLGRARARTSHGVDARASRRAAVRARARGRALRHRRRRRSAASRATLAAAPSAPRSTAASAPARRNTARSASWLVDVLNVLTGHLDEPGGAMFPKAAAFAANTPGKPGTRPRRRRPAATRAACQRRARGVRRAADDLPGRGDRDARARARCGRSSRSPATRCCRRPNGPRLAAALDQLDFMVSMDIYLNETSRHADVILPGLSPLEDSALRRRVSAARRGATTRATAPPVFDAAAGPAAGVGRRCCSLAAIVEGPGAKADVGAARRRAVRPTTSRKLSGDQRRCRDRSARRTLTGPERAARPGAAQRPLRRPLRPQARRPEARQGARPRRRGIDLGELAPRMPGDAAHALGQDRARAADAARRPAARRPQISRGRRPTMVIIGRRAGALEQQLDLAQPSATCSTARLRAPAVPGWPLRHCAGGHPWICRSKARSRL